MYGSVRSWFMLVHVVQTAHKTPAYTAISEGLSCVRLQFVVLSSLLLLHASPWCDIPIKIVFCQRHWRISPSSLFGNRPEGKVFHRPGTEGPKHITNAQTTFKPRVSVMESLLAEISELAERLEAGCVSHEFVDRCCFSALCFC